MQRKYEILLGSFTHHPVMGTYLQGDVPSFEYLMQLLDMLTADEQIMVKVGFALYQDDISATIQDLLRLPDVMFERAVEALKLQRKQIHSS